MSSGSDSDDDSKEYGEAVGGVSGPSVPPSPSAEGDSGNQSDSDGNKSDDEFNAGGNASDDDDDDDDPDEEIVEADAGVGVAYSDGEEFAEEEPDDDSEDDAESDDSDYGGGGKKKPASGKRGPKPTAKAAERFVIDDDDEEDEESDDADFRPKKGAQKKRSGASKARKGKKKNDWEPRAPRGYGERSINYADSDSDDSDSAKNKRKRAAAALAGPLIEEQGPDQDDEVERIYDHKEIEGVEAIPGDPWATRVFLVKWKRYSHIHNSWDTRATLLELGGYKRVQNYMKKAEERESHMSYMTPEEKELVYVQMEMEKELLAEHVKAERVVYERGGSKRREYLVKWCGLPYSECSWEKVEDMLEKVEGIQDKIDHWALREQRSRDNTGKTVDMARKNFKARKMEEQPEFLKGGALRDYQLDGLNWLVYAWSQDRNVILADEMGLGKTVQCASIVGYLHHLTALQGPFLIVVPLSVLNNWIREFTKWVPELNCVVYVGDSKSRAIIREYDYGTGRASGRRWKFDVLMTTYELVLKDAKILASIPWTYLIVDEAHRLKNHDSALYRELADFKFRNKLLVTGTPLQNSIRELWALLHFLEPHKFENMAEFEAQYSLTDAKGLGDLHTTLRPHLLRRVIKDVEKSLPPKMERILRVEMSPLQRKYYKMILTRNFNDLNKGVKGTGQVSLLNIVVELKKCCNHPFLFESAEFQFGDMLGGTSQSILQNLIISSSKVALLDKLLTRLKDTGHRVLIFCQMVRMLDILSDYLRLRGFQHQRLDGSTSAQARMQSMEHFNAPGSADFCFLLSTRAGGLGINLATADTVILFDSDWNPQNDLQAMSRAHRIGQKDIVNIYRLVTSGSVEEDILEKAKQKMVLDHLVIQKMDTSGRTVMDKSANKQKVFNKDELAAILRFGAEDLFKDEAKEKDAAGGEAVKAPEMDLDSILERAEHVAAKEAEGPGDGVLGAFNRVETFAQQEDDATFWSRLIPVEEIPKAPELMPRAARLEAPTSYAEHAPGEVAADPDTARRNRDREKEQRQHASEMKKLERLARDIGGPVEGALLRVDAWLAGDPGAGGQAGDEAPPPPPAHAPLTKKDAVNFTRAVKRFGGKDRLDEIALETGGAVEAAAPEDRVRLWESLVRGCDEVVRKGDQELEAAAMRAPAREDGDGGAAAERKRLADPVLDFFGVPVKAHEVAARVRELSALARKVRQCADPPAQFRLETDLHQKPPVWGKALGWWAKDDAMLLLGVHMYGFGHWDKIRSDPTLDLGGKLGGNNGAAPAPKASHLDTRAAMLLKRIRGNPEPPRGRGAGGGAKRARPAGGAAGPKEKRPKEARRDSEDKPSVNMVAKADMKPVKETLKKLRVLQKVTLSNEKLKDKTKKYLLIVGKHIDSVMAGGSPEGEKHRVELWEVVSGYTPRPANILQSLYEKLKAIEEGASQAPGGGSNEAGGGAPAANGAPPPAPGPLGPRPTHQSAAHPAPLKRPRSIEEGELPRAPMS